MNNQQISDNGRESKYFHQIVNMADDDLNVYQYRLYGHYKRVCGASADGVCWESTRTTAEKCKMSVGKVVSTRRELVELGYIELTAAGREETLAVELKDLMLENVARYTKGGAWANDTLPKSAKHADNLLSAFLHGDALNGAWNANIFEDSTKKLVTYLATALPNKQLLKEELAKTAESPELFFTTLSHFMKAAGLDCTICASYAKTATTSSIARALDLDVHSMNMSQRGVHDTNINVHSMNIAPEEGCSPHEPKKNLKTQEPIEEEKEAAAPEVENEKSPSPHNAMFDAVSWAWRNSSGGYVGKLIAFLTGKCKPKDGKYHTHMIRNPMTPLEVVAFRLWRDYHELDMPKLPETIERLVEEFRGVPEYDRLLEAAAQHDVKRTPRQPDAVPEFDTSDAPVARDVNSVLDGVLAQLGGG